MKHVRIMMLIDNSDTGSTILEQFQPSQQLSGDSSSKWALSSQVGKEDRSRHPSG